MTSPETAENDVNHETSETAAPASRLRGIARALWLPHEARGEGEQAALRLVASRLRAAYSPVGQQVDEVLADCDRRFEDPHAGSRALVAAGFYRLPWSALLDAALPVNRLPAPAASDWRRLLSGDAPRGAVWATERGLRDLRAERAHVQALPVADAAVVWLTQRYLIGRKVLTHGNRVAGTRAHVAALSADKQRKLVRSALRAAAEAERRCGACRVFQRVAAAGELGVDFGEAAAALAAFVELQATREPRGVVADLEGEQ